VSLGRADLLFDQMEVVEQPLTRRRNPAVRRYRRSQPPGKINIPFDANPGSWSALYPEF
jgi:hypothetical protein